MKTALSTIFAMLALTLALPVSAQTSERLEQSYQEKVQGDFVQKVKWERSFDAALARAKKEKKLVWAYFTRSYAPCPPCSALESGPLLSEWWVKISTEFVPYLNINAKLDDKPDQKVPKALNVVSYPFCVFVDVDGIILAEARPESERAFRESMGVAQAIVDIAGILARDPKNEAALAGKGLLTGMKAEPPESLAALDKLAAVAGVDPRVLARYKSYRYERPIADIFAAARKGEFGKSPKEMTTRISQRLYKLWKDEKLTLPVEHRMAAPYYNYVVMGAIDYKDKEGAQTAFELLKAAVELLSPDLQTTAKSDLKIYEKQIEGLIQAENIRKNPKPEPGDQEIK